MQSDFEILLSLSSEPNLIIRGGNSKVFKIRYESEDYCLKDYAQRIDSEKRLLREFNSLKILNKFNPDIFARPIVHSLSNSQAVYTWLEGSRPNLNIYSIGYMMHVMEEINRLSKDLNNSKFEMATDSIIEVFDVHDQIKNRIRNLKSKYPRISKIFMDEFDYCESFLIANKMLSDSPTHILSVSDLGPHNLLWNEGKNQIHCVDLEFFGWDDGHKLAIDTLLHPKINWDYELASYFLDKFRLIHKLNDKRLLDFWGFLNLKWGLIMLSKKIRLLEIDSVDPQNSEEISQIKGYFLRAMKITRSLDDMMEEVAKIVRDSESARKGD